MHTVQYNSSRSIARSSHLTVINFQPNVVCYFRIFHYFLAINDTKKNKNKKINQSFFITRIPQYTNQTDYPHMDGKSFTFARNNGTKVAVIDTIESNLVGLSRNQPRYSKLLSRFEKEKRRRIPRDKSTFSLILYSIALHYTLSYYILYYINPVTHYPHITNDHGRMTA